MMNLTKKWSDIALLIGLPASALAMASCGGTGNSTRLYCGANVAVQMG